MKKRKAKAKAKPKGRASHSAVRLVLYWRVTYRCGHWYDHDSLDADILGLSRKEALAESKELCIDCQQDD
jgi:hypothetical protein